MFCPHCRAEYREGFTACEDCGVDLIHIRPLASESQFIDYEEVLGTYNQGDIATIKSIFNHEGLTYFIKGENFTGLGAFIDPARVMVRKDQAAYAREIVRELDLSFAAISLNHQDADDHEDEHDYDD